MSANPMSLAACRKLIASNHNFKRLWAAQIVSELGDWFYSLAIYQAFSGASDAEMKSRFTGLRYGDLKKEVAGMVIAHLEPFQERYRRIASEPGYLAGVLREGESL